MHSASVFATDITKGLLHTRLVACLHCYFHRVKQCRRLSGLPVLPKLIAVPNRKRAKYHYQHRADQSAPGIPKMLELIELLLFFEIELICHVL